ncbi:MAG: sigma-70 family RNA polymerase sigma factor [Planctomycetota bacterium]
MKPSSFQPDDPEALAEQVSWVRDLARRIAGDAHEADDLAQDAWVAVLRTRSSGGGEIRSVRSYLAGVVRNARRLARRGEARRREHEHRAAGDAPLAADASAALERAELAKALVGRVLALEEPFRSTVLLRFGEGLSTADTAARLGVPAKTVESRARRGLARLREAWLREHGGDERSWRGALTVLAAPLGRSAAPVPIPTGGGAGLAGPAVPSLLGPLGALAMQLKLIAVCLVAAGSAGAAWLWTERDADAARPAARVAERPRGAPQPEIEALAADPVAPARADRQLTETLPAIEPQLEAVAASEAVAAERVVRGVVFDASGRPYPGITVACFRAWDRGRPSVRARSDADGRFELVLHDDGAGEVRSDEPHLVTLVAARIGGDASRSLPIVVAPHRALSGRVVDAAGQPLPGTRVGLATPDGFLARFDAVFDRAEVHAPWVTTDAKGVFELTRAAAVPEARVIARREGYLEGQLDAPLTPAAGLELVLTRAPGSELLSGRVVDAGGEPLEDAWVSLGAKSTLTEAGGRFSLSREDADHATELRAVKSGHRAAFATADVDPTSGEPTWPDWIELRLGGPPLALAGVVVDERGEPRAGVSLWIEDATPFGLLGEDEVGARVEYMLGAGVEPTQDPGDAYWHSTGTDEGGGFELGGLLDRAYSLRLLDARRQETLVAGPFQAGLAGLRVVFPRVEQLPLRGRVVSRSGAAQDGVEVQLYSKGFGGTWLLARTTRTDESGDFAFDAVGAGHIGLRLIGDHIVPGWEFFEDGDDPRGRELTLEVSALRHLKIELADAARADAVRMLGAAGETLSLCEIGASGTTFHQLLQLIDGRSRTVGVAEEAATLILYREGDEVERVTVRLAPDTINLLTL